jgi:2-dehydropantoate 2-reductase
MRIAVIGAGGVGGFFGGKLAAAGLDVVFLARGQTLERLRHHGLIIDSAEGLQRIEPVRATDDPASIGPVDAVLIAVKAWQVHEAARSIKPLIGDRTAVVPLQNGVEAPDQLIGELGPEPVLGGLCKIIAFTVEPGHIRHAGVVPQVILGELNNQSSRRSERLKKAFETAGVSAEIPQDIHAAMWEKFLFICSVSGMGALTRAPIGPIRDNPQTRAMLEQAKQEIFRLARARGVDLREGIVKDSMAFVDELPWESTASMQRDIMEGLPSELEAQSGAVLRLGREAGLDAPLHRAMYTGLLLSEKRARGEIDY